MKKHDEGYALVFVLVVLVVLCIIAIGIMDFSLRNLESQQNTIHRMEAKYEAAGKIEEIVAAIENGSNLFFPVIEQQIAFAESEEQDTLKIAASQEAGEEQPLWVIAELKLSKTDWPVTITTSGLQVEKRSSVAYLRYEVVDSDEVAAFLNGGNG